MTHAAMEYEALLQGSIQVTKEMLSDQDKYFMKLRSRNYHNENVIHQLSKRQDLQKYLENEAGVSPPAPVRRSINNMYLHDSLRVYARSQCKAGYMITTCWRLIWGAKSGPEMWAAHLFGDLRDGKFAPNDIVQQAAVEEIFLSTLRDGEVSEDNLSLMALIGDPGGQGFKQREKDITGLARAFLIRQVDPNGFSLQRSTWIKDLSKHIGHANSKHAQVLNGMVDSLIDCIYVNIERIDQILIKIYTNKHLQVDDCNFLFEKVERKFWSIDKHCDGIIQNKKYKRIATALKDVLMPESLDEIFQEFLPYLHSTTPTTVPFRVRKNGAPLSDKDILFAPSENRPDRDVELEYRYSTNWSLFEVDCKIYQDRFDRLMAGMERIHQQFISGSQQIQNDISTVHDWYFKIAHMFLSKDGPTGISLLLRV